LLASLLAFPTLVVWALVYPGLMVYVLRKYKKQLDSPEVQGKYGFIYRGYRYEKFFWEFVILARKILMVATLVFLANATSGLQVIVVNIILQAALYDHLKNAPFQAKEVNDLEEKSLLCLVILGITGLFYSIVNSNTAYDIVIMIICFIASGIFFFKWIRNYLSLQYSTQLMNPKVQKILERLKLKFPCLKSDEEKHHAETKGLVENEAKDSQSERNSEKKNHEVQINEEKQPINFEDKELQNNEENDAKQESMKPQSRKGTIIFIEDESPVHKISQSHSKADLEKERLHSESTVQFAEERQGLKDLSP